jgi:methionyl-tRNA formyltransferase
MEMHDIVFIGSGPWGNAVLSGLLRCTGIRLVSVVTDDSSQSQFSMAAKDCDVNVFDSWDRFLEKIASAKLGICAGWKKIPQRVFDLPKMGFVNVHGSLLPKYRGPEPLERQYIEGEAEIGVTIHQISNQIDSGNVFAQRKIQVPSSASLRDYMMKLSLCAANLIRESIYKIATGEIQSYPQQEQNATSFPFLSPNDGILTLDGDPHIVFRKIACLGNRGWARIAHRDFWYYVGTPEIIMNDYCGPSEIDIDNGTSTLIIKVAPLAIRTMVQRVIHF